jgi:hypothetical protein
VAQVYDGRTTTRRTGISALHTNHYQHRAAKKNDSKNGNTDTKLKKIVYICSLYLRSEKLHTVVYQRFAAFTLKKNHFERQKDGL